MKILLMCGHKNIQNITQQGLRSWRNVSALKRSTGASGEMDYFDKKVIPLLKEKLEAIGVEVDVIDAIWNDKYNTKHDLFISFHFDGGGTENRCMISSPLRNKIPAYLNDEAHKIADEFCKVWKEIYPNLTGTVNRDNRITAGMLEYYGFDYTNVDTPSVIIEHFNHTSEQGEKLKQDAEKVANADFEVIKRFFKLDNVCMPEIKVKEDIPTEYEDALGLKSYNWYSKNWSWLDMFNQTTQWWNDSKKLEEVKDILEVRKKELQDQAEELSKLKQSLSEFETVLQNQNKLINELKLNKPEIIIKEVEKELTAKEALQALIKAIKK